MAKPEWGTKRTCPHCGARFYDLRRETIVCPKCDTPYDAQVDAKPKRVRVLTEKKAEAGELLAENPATDLAKDRKKKPDITVPSENEDFEDSELKDVEVLQAVESDKAEDIIEDASELSEDEVDMAEVIENVDEEKGP